MENANAYKNQSLATNQISVSETDVIAITLLNGITFLILFRALLYITHGYGSHLWSNFDVIGTYFARRGYLVFGHDNLGHGRTTGERAQLSTTLEEDFALPVVAHCRARKRLDGTNGIPLFILGHSFGSLISLIAAARAPPGIFFKKNVGNNNNVFIVSSTFKVFSPPFLCI